MPSHLEKAQPVTLGPLGNNQLEFFWKQQNFGRKIQPVWAALSLQELLHFSMQPLHSSSIIMRVNVARFFDGANPGPPRGALVPPGPSDSLRGPEPATLVARSALEASWPWCRLRVGAGRDRAVTASVCLGCTQRCPGPPRAGGPKSQHLGHWGSFGAPGCVVRVAKFAGLAPGPDGPNRDSEEWSGIRRDWGGRDAVNLGLSSNWTWRTVRIERRRGILRGHGGQSSREPEAPLARVAVAESEQQMRRKWTWVCV